MSRIMNSTRAWCVMAHSDRLKRFMVSPQFVRPLALRLTVRTLRPVSELLHAQCDDLVAVAEAGRRHQRVVINRVE